MQNLKDNILKFHQKVNRNPKVNIKNIKERQNKGRHMHSIAIVKDIANII